MNLQTERHSPAVLKKFTLTSTDPQRKSHNQMNISVEPMTMGFLKHKREKKSKEEFSFGLREG